MIAAARPGPAATPRHPTLPRDPSEQRTTNSSGIPSPQVAGVGIAPCQRRVNDPGAAA